MPKETVLVLCAHPDDEIIGLGGTIAKYSKQGKEVITVIFSYGESSHPWMKKKYTVQKRVDEAKKADRIVGTSKTIFLGLRDGMLMKYVKSRKVEQIITNLIKRYKPKKIFTHSHDDMIFADHKAVNNVVTKVLKKIKYQGEVYIFDIWNPMTIRRRSKPKMIVDVSDTFRKKQKALKCFKSQSFVIAELKPMIYIRAIKNGLSIRARFAEKFYKV
ncbi:PIG-L family deacetylase [Candidatus Woesearchaeota archaeon]|nr:PIG-L family deacetylase [Candidatus Woesearchaeota archaeon]